MSNNHTSLLSTMNSISLFEDICDIQERYGENTQNNSQWME